MSGTDIVGMVVLGRRDVAATMLPRVAEFDGRQSESFAQPGIYPADLHSVWGVVMIDTEPIVQN